MSSSSTPPRLPSAELESIETRMRRALDRVGGPTGSAEQAQGDGPKPDARTLGQPNGIRPRQRFALDGTTPFESARRHRPIEPRPLDPAPAGNQDGERPLQEALAAAHDLQTKLGHAELKSQETARTMAEERAKSEAFRTEMLEQVGALQQQLAGERTSREAAEAALLALQATTPAQAVETSAPVKKPRKAAAPREREPQPVKWWIKKPVKR